MSPQTKELTQRRPYGEYCLKCSGQQMMKKHRSVAGIWLPRAWTHSGHRRFQSLPCTVNSLMFAGINVCVFETKPCSWGLIFAANSGLVSYLGT